MIEAYFDCSSPWTYLAFEGLLSLSEELDVPVEWKPILVGGIFNTVNPSVYAQRADPVPAKARYMLKDLGDWARHAGLDIRFPPSVFPVNSVKVMRGCLHLAPRGQLVPFARAAFEAYWGDDLDMSKDEVVAEICRRAGVDTEDLFAGIARPEVKDQLRVNTEAVVARGGFGSPTIFVGGTDMYFGNDRLPLVREAVLRARTGG
ncbi:MAG: 2-hydroxychromene-2-carboxylate isomerase [Phenylobacterium sp.]|uniref:2-hydroxychromene-2-carboxylate isomerase n=1 Tax=Phenylobacterium sp. TaxID=1871053 RepID=UPI0025DF3CEB|nr:2-hydroxychromene-2-carboxylate isomerase [Phenylobacterium sp.]MCA6258680.1 2-hydroxychromene-2-carboxylate isomerase [Phenylobacterium sp.]MCA6308743.1 2-hydroxychromene-2-carboxylate isomerase [Phenylobacterium sp.]